VAIFSTLPNDVFGAGAERVLEIGAVIWIIKSFLETILNEKRIKKRSNSF
jgi:hypothetical protein